MIETNLKIFTFAVHRPTLKMEVMVLISHFKVLSESENIFSSYLYKFVTLSPK